MSAEGDLDEWAIIQYTTDPPCARLVTDIVGHPAGLICLEELCERNPDMDEDAIKEHLSVLYSLQVIEPHALPAEEQETGYPERFFAITDEAAALFDANDLFCPEAWGRQYAEAMESDRLAELASAPRPAV